MSLTLVTGPANAGRAEVVLDTFRAELAREREPILVVPTALDVGYYLRELATEGATRGARVERFRGLMELAASLVPAPSALLAGAARERVIAVIAGELGLGESAGVVRGLAEAIAELRERRVRPGRLTQAFAGWSRAAGAPIPAAVLGDAYAAYERRLQELRRTDSEGRAVQALDALRERPSLWQGRPVLFYGFDDLTPLQLDAIDTLARVVDAPVTVSLAYEPGRAALAGRAAVFHALAPLASEHRVLPARSEHYAAGSRRALAHVERSLFEPDATRVAPEGAVRLLEGGGQRAELELVAAEIAAQIAEGTPPEEITLVHRATPAGAGLLEEVLRDAGIPFAMRISWPAMNSGIGAALVALLRCAAPAASATLEDLLIWLRAPGLLERPELADALEAKARRRGVRDAATARAIWEEENWPLDALARLALAAENGPVPLLDRARRELQRLFAAPRRRSAAILGAEEVDEARALAAIDRALAELRDLALADASAAPADPAALARELERVRFVVGARAAPGLVAVVGPLDVRARRVRALFVCGIQEGVLPAPARAQPFLGADERRGLAEHGGLRVGEQRDVLAAERYLFYALLSRPEEVLGLSWHLADDDGEPTPRSLFIDDVCDLFTAELENERRRRELGALDAAVGGAVGAGARGPGALTDAETLAELDARPWSASSLELWKGCPVRWFMERMLSPAQLDAEAEPLARGAVAHDALSDVLAGLRRERGSARVTGASLPRALELLRAALAERWRERPLSAAAERLAPARRRLRADLERFLASEAERESPLEPTYLELGFGFAPDEPVAEGEQPDAMGDGTRGEEQPALPALELGDGRRLRGRIDRIDVDAHGRAVVFDYKNKRAPGPSRWIADGNLQVPLYMRAAEALLDLEVVGGFYQPLSGETLRPRGILDTDAGLALDCVRGDEREPDAVRELLDEALASARTAAGQAAHGALESRPTTCSWDGSGCAYPTICRRER